MIQMRFLQRLFSVDRIHSHQIAPAVFPVGVVQPADERVRFARVAEREKCLEGERRVSEPGEAVVPVALPADAFRQ
jgi:hypothetical protein